MASFSSDGKQIITTGERGVGFWDAITGNLISGLTSYPLDEVVVSEDGKSAIAASGDKVKILHLDTKLEEEKTSARPLSNVEKNWISPNGILVMSSRGSAIQIWEPMTGRVVGSNVAEITHLHPSGLDPRFPDIVPTKVRFSPDGQLVAYTSREAKGFALLRLPDGDHSQPQPTATSSPTPEAAFPETSVTAVVPLEGLNETVTSMEFADDSKSLLTVSLEGLVRVWDTQTGKNLTNLTMETEDVINAVFSPDAKYVLTVSPAGTIRAWNIASQTLYATLRGHNGPIFHMDFSRDGKSLLTTSFDGTARIWKWPPNAWRTQPAVLSPDKLSQATMSANTQFLFAKNRDGAQLTKLATKEQITYPGYQVAFHAGKSLVAAAQNESRIEIRDLTGRSRTHLLSDPDRMNNLRFSKTGQYILCAGTDNITRVFDATTGKSIAVLEGDRAVFSPNEKLILTTDSKGGRSWDWQAGEENRLRASIGKGPILLADFSPDSQLILTDYPDRQAHLWNALTGKPIQTFPRHRTRITDLEFSPDGKLVVSVDDYAAQVCEVKTDAGSASQPQCIELTGRTRPTSSAAFSPDGKYIVTAGGRYAQLWEASAAVARSIADFKLDGTGSSRMQRAAFSPDGKYLITANGDTLAVWLLATGQVLTHKIFPEDVVVDALMSPDNNWVVSVTKSGQVVMWDWQHADNRTNKTSSAPGSLFALSPKGDSVVTAGRVGIGGVWEAKTWDSGPDRQVARFEGFTSNLDHLIFSPDGNLLGGSADDQVLLWSARTGELKMHASLVDLDSATSLAFSSDSKKFAAASDRSIRVWDTNGSDVFRKLDGHRDTVTSVAFSPDGQFMVSASKDRTIRIWSAKDEKEVAILRGHFDEVNSVAFSADGRFVLSASQDRTARVWEWQDSEKWNSPVVLKGHNGPVQSAVFSPDDKFVLTTGADHSVMLWNRSGGQSLAELIAEPGAISSAEFSPDGKSIITAGENGARIYNCQECGSGKDLLAQMDELIKKHPLLEKAKP